MTERIITGFHAIEERVLSIKNNSPQKSPFTSEMKIFYAKPGPRVKKILDEAKAAGIPSSQTDSKSLDNLVKSLPEASRDHRGIVLCVTEQGGAKNKIDFDDWILNAAAQSKDEKQTVVILDSITDVHNIGAILRSGDQFGVSLVILPEHRGANNIFGNEIIARTSAGASEYVPVCVVQNLVRAVKKLKDAGFWVYGADADGYPLHKMNFSSKTALVMGSEGNGISRLLQEQCDSIISIPTRGKINSLNVSVATGILLYEITRTECAK